ncbi:MAG: hypothetical protein LBL92_01520 [Propionibacteriaceae bacterium]|jgi:hypothetical protein|nr:hypothetical protein [Propionibacteriaceae bacterium]
MTTVIKGRTTRKRPVRVSDEAHDILSRLSERDQVSIPDVIEQLARQAEWAEICRSEQAAFAADLKSPAAMADYELWDETDDDVE